MIPVDLEIMERRSLSANFKTVFRSIFTSLTLIQNIRVVAPALGYMFLQLAVMVLYLWSLEKPWTSFWALFLGGVGAGDIARFPAHLLLMQPILGRVDMLLGAFVQVIFQAATVCLVSAAFRRKTVSIRAATAESIRRYPKLLFVSLLSSALVYAFINLARHLSENMDGIARMGIAGSGVLFALAIQTLFLFSIPIIMHRETPASRIVPESFRAVAELPIASAIIVIVSFFITLPTTFLSLKAAMIALQLSPDFMIHSHIASTIMEMTANFLLMAGATIIFIHKIDIRREKE